MAVSEEIQRKVLAEATSATPNYDVDYSDKRFGKVESDKDQALTKLEQTYSGVIDGVDEFYDKQIQASKDWADKQAQLNQEQTDFAIEKIEQQKDQATKDYQKEQSGAYVDWQKQSNQYGVNAEQMASAGLTNTGFAESSQVGMYNAYQNRVAMARESYNKAVLNYANAIKDAMLQNNAALAEIAFQALQQQLELSLEGFQYKNQLIIEQANKQTELENVYYNRYQDVLEQINHENALKEDIRQYNESMAWNTEQKELDRAFEAEQSQKDRTFKAQEAELDRQHSAAQAEIQRKFQSAQAELDRKHDKEMLAAQTKAAKEKAEHDHKLAMEKLAKQQEYELAQLNKQLANEKALLQYKNSLSSQSVGSLKSGSSGSSKKTPTKSSYSTSLQNQHGKVTTSGTFKGSTYDQAIAYLKSKGINGSGVMTASEWSRRKSSYSMTGIGNAAVKNYSSYSAYLRDYVNYTASK